MISRALATLKRSSTFFTINPRTATTHTRVVFRPLDKRAPTGPGSQPEFRAILVPDESHLCVRGSVQAVPDTPTRLRVLVGLVALEGRAMGTLALVLAIGLLTDRTSTQVGFVVA